MREPIYFGYELSISLSFTKILFLLNKISKWFEIVSKQFVAVAKLSIYSFSYRYKEFSYYNEYRQSCRFCHFLCVIIQWHI